MISPVVCGEYESPDAIGLLIQSGRTIDAIPLNGWRIDVGYPEDRDRAEKRLDEIESGSDTEREPESVNRLGVKPRGTRLAYL